MKLVREVVENIVVVDVEDHVPISVPLLLQSASLLVVVREGAAHNAVKTRALSLAESVFQNTVGLRASVCCAEESGNVVANGQDLRGSRRKRFVQHCMDQRAVVPPV